MKMGPSPRRKPGSKGFRASEGRWIPACAGMTTPGALAGCSGLVLPIGIIPYNHVKTAILAGELAQMLWFDNRRIPSGNWPFLRTVYAGIRELEESLVNSVDLTEGHGQSQSLAALRHTGKQSCAVYWISPRLWPHGGTQVRLLARSSAPVPCWKRWRHFIRC